MTTVIIDFQGFRGNNKEFIIKELVFALNEDEINKFIIKQPHEMQAFSKTRQTQQICLSENFHGLSWGCGSVDYKSVIQFLKFNIPKDAVIYMKGKEKKWLIEEMLDEDNNNVFYNLDDFGCPSLKELRKKFKTTVQYTAHYALKRRATDPACALQNVAGMQSFLKTLMEKEMEDIF